MSVDGVGAIGASGGSGAVYALSPYLNGVVRTPDAVAAAEAAAAASTPSVAETNPAAVAALAQASVDAGEAAPPFANPAITDIAEQTSLNAALQGDAGLLVQSYGAVALIAGPLALAQVYAQPVVPAIPPVAPVTPAARAVDQEYSVRR